MPEFPKSLLHHVAWSFADKQPADVAALRASIAKFYATLEDRTAPADELYQVQVPSCRVVLVSWYLKEPVTVEHATLFDAGTLLVAAHRALAPKLRNRDHHFFEGFDLQKAEPDKPPVYDVCLGS
jgi:hypothetical protein